MKLLTVAAPVSRRVDQRNISGERQAGACRKRTSLVGQKYNLTVVPLSPRTRQFPAHPIIHGEFLTDLKGIPEIVALVILHSSRERRLG